MPDLDELAREWGDLANGPPPLLVRWFEIKPSQRDLEFARLRAGLERAFGREAGHGDEWVPEDLGIPLPGSDP